MYFDTHAHYDHGRFKDRGKLLDSLNENGVDLILNIGIDRGSSLNSIKMAQVFPFMYASAGFHPHNASAFTSLDEIRSFAKMPKVVALGEMGLDFHYNFSPRDVQEEVFKAQLTLAPELDMPVIIHCREAVNEVYTILKAANLQRENPGVMHCYSGDLTMAEKFAEMGYFLGIGGPVTYKNAKNIKEVVKHIPLEKLLIETDAPYLAPEPNRGKRNDSSNLQYIANAIGELKNISAEDVAKTTMENGLRLFAGISSV